ncbi:DUF1064 domain-containing protein [Ensifer adhaerens]|uniref:DUF1064 domain-containing protein n=1 Tax=Ensifer adhaerens TaxID=106592 RepID=UPI000DC28698|nr:DUF1064 domain-containing protein [Ensifer adhaerens]RAS13528.1 uncharacterized protein DUF1064 [Ensifer adhaerens]
MNVRLSSQEYRAQTAKPKRNKYGAKRTVIDGVLFDSKAEATYYTALKMREKAGEVSAVELQRPFSLLGPKGELICTYKADFCFWDHKADRFRVVDVKGVETSVFKLKRKMMKVLLGIEVETTK